MCDCISTLENELSEELTKQIEEKIKVADWEDEGFMNKAFALNGGPTRIGMPFIMQYRRLKTNGEKEKNIQTKNVTMYPTFCPFCGIKYEE